MKSHNKNGIVNPKTFYSNAIESKNVKLELMPRIKCNASHLVPPPIQDGPNFIVHDDWKLGVIRHHNVSMLGKTVFKAINKLNLFIQFIRHLPFLKILRLKATGIYLQVKAMLYPPNVVPTTPVKTIHHDQQSEIIGIVFQISGGTRIPTS